MLQSLLPMGNATDICTNTAQQQLEIAQTGENFSLPKKKELEPIVFEENEQCSETPIEKEKITLKILDTPSKVGLLEQKTFNTNKSSLQKWSKLDLDKMVVINQSTPERALHIEDGLIGVPFAVIRLAMNENLRKSIREYGNQIFSTHEKDGSFNNWKLHRKGYYINHLGDQLYAVMTNTTYFEGRLIELNSEILPSNEGILFSQKGMYTGNFQNGKANGKGQFKELQSKAVFKGTWKDGVMVQGLIEHQDFKFEGRLQNLLANGKGKIVFKESAITYTGRFEDGLFSDTKGFLQSKYYIYEGGFEEGRKEGIGCLVQKELPQKDKKLKYRPPEQYQGKWHHDSFEGPLTVTTNKK